MKEPQIDTFRTEDTTGFQNQRINVAIAIFVLLSVCIVLSFFFVVVFNPGVAEPPELEEVVPETVDDP